MISVFDITVSDNNLGNEIIMESAYSYLRSAFPTAFFIKLPYLDSIGGISIEYVRQSEYVFFPGGNSLTSDMKRYKQWGLDRTNANDIKDVVLMGVGWWQYQGEPTRYTRRVLQKVLHHDLYHSVRDTYTAEKLSSIGFQNVLVTGCPSLWKLSAEHCRSIPQDKSDNVLFTFTDYNRSSYDRKLMHVLTNKYKRLIVWPQGPDDGRYAKELYGNVEILAPTVAALDRLLSLIEDIDYVGTRLHAGIRALQYKRRSVIIGIDNRAIEQGKDFGLPVIFREDIEAIEKAIDNGLRFSIELPFSNIKKWLKQFEDLEPLCLA